MFVKGAAEGNSQCWPEAGEGSSEGRTWRGGGVTRAGLRQGRAERGGNEQAREGLPGPGGLGRGGELWPRGRGRLGT